MEFREVVHAVKQASGKPKEQRIGGKYRSVKVCCPCHHDATPSLCITDFGNGKIGMYDFGGCQNEEILSSANLTSKDLFYGNEPEREKKQPDAFEKMLNPLINQYGQGVHIAAVYNYEDANGDYLYSKIRFEGGTMPKKEFKTYAIAQDKKNFKLRPKESKTLYNLPELLKGIREKQTVFYAEGEKDVETLKHLDLVATSAGGTKDWRSEYAEYFQGADVVILQDNDASGESLTETMKSDLTGKAERVRVVVPSNKPKGDVSDYLAEGHTLEDLMRLVAAAPEVECIDLAPYHLLSDKGKPSKPFDDAIERTIKRQHPMFIMGGVPYLYRGGAYAADVSGAELCSIIKRYLYPQFVTANTIKRIYSLFLIDADLIRTYDEINKYPDSWVIFKNCVVDGRTGEWFELSPHLYALNQIPWNYEVGLNGSGSRFTEFLREAVGQSDIKTVMQYLGLCLTKDNTFQKFVLLRGSRGTGKSVLLSVFQMILGRENYASVPLQNIEDRFSKVQLLGKLVDICGDLPATAMQTVSTIKQITGGDVLFAEFKGRDGFSFRPYARLIFSCNTAPKNLDEKSNAFFERLIILEMNHRPEKPDRTLTEKIRKEIPYILRDAVEALQEVYRNNEIYESQGSREKVQDLYAESDSVTAFLNEKIEKLPTGKIKTSELHERYKEYCEQEEREPLSRNGFFANIRAKGIGKKKIDGTYYFNGIAWLGDTGNFTDVMGEEMPFD